MSEWTFLWLRKFSELMFLLSDPTAPTSCSRHVEFSPHFENHASFTLSSAEQSLPVSCSAGGKGNISLCGMMELGRQRVSPRYPLRLGSGSSVEPRMHGGNRDSALGPPPCTPEQTYDFGILSQVLWVTSIIEIQSATHSADKRLWEHFLFNFCISFWSLHFTHEKTEAWRVAWQMRQLSPAVSPAPNALLTF